jgi:hypothetical protein
MPYMSREFSTINAHADAVQAPTAQKVELLHFWQLRGGQPEVKEMSRSSKGVWSCPRPADWMNT